MTTPQYDVPVLYLVFNRPEHTRRSFEAIRARRPSRLFIAADGPRAHVPTDRQRTEEVRRIASNVDWPCEVNTLVRETNLGCADAVSQAITWFFGHVGSGIILEDDCVPGPAFWDYCALMLECYRDEPRVMCVSGNNFLPRGLRPRAPYYFSRYPNIWGWATWARAWGKYQHGPLPESSPALGATLRNLRIGNPLSRWWWRRTLEKYCAPAGGSWDYRWTYAIWMNDGLSVAPSRNLVANIGFDEDATHGGRRSFHPRFGLRETWSVESAHGHTPKLRADPLADTVYDLYMITGRNLLGSAVRSAAHRLLPRGLH